MHREYKDIISRLGQPIWYDEHAVPRYEPFSPELVGVYDEYVGYLEIACQDCGRKFFVSQSIRLHEIITTDLVLPSTTGIGSFHYGDPPIHDCVGDTMNVQTLRVLEFWERKFPSTDWSRKSEFELEVKDPLWDD